MRIQVPATVLDQEGRVITRVDPDYVWDYIDDHHEKWRTEHVRIIYMTRRALHNDTTLIVDSRDFDSLTDFLIEHILPVKHVRGVWVVGLGKMRFFKIPSERRGEHTRFTVNVDVLPQHVEEVYDNISTLKPKKDIMINYIAHTFQSFSASLIVSALAPNRNDMDDFVDETIRSMDGVVNAEVMRICRTKRLVSPEEWQESVGPFFFAEGGQMKVRLDAHFDDSMLGGC